MFKPKHFRTVEHSSFRIFKYQNIEIFTFLHLFASKFSNFDTPKHLNFRIFIFSNFIFSNIWIFEFLYFQIAFFTNLQMFVYLCLATFNILFVFLQYSGSRAFLHINFHEPLKLPQENLTYYQINVSFDPQTFIRLPEGNLNIDKKRSKFVWK